MLQPIATTFNIICLSLASASPIWHSQPAGQPAPNDSMEVSPGTLPAPVMIDLTETPPPPTGGTGGPPPPTGAVGGG